MAKPKIMTVYGTRPEAIKVAPVIKTLGLDDRFDSVSVSTGQHREMLDQVNQMFEITPDYDLGLMKKVSTLSGVVSMALSGLDEIIDKEKPDVIISQGDTSTAMSAALAGFHREVKIVHLEAGLRTGNISSPFPEEANRRIIGQVTSLHLAPTETSRDNLRRVTSTPRTSLSSEIRLLMLCWKQPAGRPRSPTSASTRWLKLISVLSWLLLIVARILRPWPKLVPPSRSLLRPTLK